MFHYKILKNHIKMVNKIKILTYINNQYYDKNIIHDEIILRKNPVICFLDF